MKNRILFLLSAVLLSVTAFSQVTNKIQADSVKIYQVGNHPAELIIENATRTKTGGVLKNTNNGRTQFDYVVDSIWVQDSLLHIKRGPVTSQYNLKAAVPNTGGVGSFNTRYSITKGSGDSAQLVGDIATPKPGYAYGFDTSGNRTFIRPAPDTTKTVEILKAASFENIDSLRASDLYKKGLRRVWTQGYYTKGDGGDATYQWVDTSTKTDDSSFVIKPIGNTGNGRWEFIPKDNSYNFLALGAKGDNSTDNYWTWVKFQNKMSRSKSVRLIVPDGNYIFTNGIEQTKPFDVVGSSTSVFWFPKSDTGIYIHGSMFGLVPSWRSMKVNALAKDTLDGKYTGIKSFNVHDYKYDGIVCTTIANFYNTVVRGFSGHGWRIYGSVQDLAVGINTAGSGYTDGIYNDRIMAGGSGSEMNLQITVSGGVVTALNIIGPGNHYIKGDILTAPTLPGGTGFTAIVNAESSNASGCRFYDCGSEANTGAGMVFTGPDANQCSVISMDARENSLTGLYDSSFLGTQFINCEAHLNGYLSGPGWGHYRIGLNVNARSSLTNCYGESNDISSSYIGGQSISIGGLHEEGLIGGGQIFVNGSWNHLNVDDELHVGGTSDAGAFALQVEPGKGTYLGGNVMMPTLLNDRPAVELIGRSSDNYFVHYDLPTGVGGGNTNSNIGSGYRLAVPYTNNIKTLYGSYGFNLDSALNSNGITFVIDSNLFVSSLMLKKKVDSLGAVIAASSGGSLTQYQIGIGDGSNLLSGNSAFTYNTSTGRLLVGYTTSQDNSWLHQINGSLWVGNGSIKNFSVDDVGNTTIRGNGYFGGGSNSDYIIINSAAADGWIKILNTNADSYIFAKHNLILGAGESYWATLKSDGKLALSQLGTTGNRIVARNSSSELYDTGIDPSNLVTASQVHDTAQQLRSEMSSLSFTSPVQTLNAQYTDQQNIGSSETTLYTYTLASNQMVSDGDKLEIKYSGVFTSPTGAILRFKFGGNSRTLPTVSANEEFSMTADFIRTGTTTARVRYTVMGAFDKVIDVQTYDITGLDFTTTNTILLSGQDASTGQIIAKTSTITYYHYTP